MRPTLHGNSQPWHAARTSVSSSYEEERSEVGKALLKFTERGLKRTTASGLLVEAARNSMLPFIVSLGPVQKAMLGLISETAIEYRSGLRSPWLRTRYLVWLTEPPRTPVDSHRPWTSGVRLAARPYSASGTKSIVGINSGPSDGCARRAVLVPQQANDPGG